MRPIFSFVFASLAVPVAYAQELGREPAGALDAVVVTATRSEQDPLQVPAAIDRIDAEAIGRAQPRADLSESLPRVPGVLARDRQNRAQDLQISVRGFGTRASFGVRGVRLYSDGIPATMPDGQGQVSHFVLEAADRIEVLRGPFSALYGNSSGGVIQIFSAPPPDRTEIAGAFAAGADGFRRGSLSWRGPWPAGEGGYRFDVGTVNDDGYREHSRARRDSAQIALQGAFGGDGEFRVVANALDLEADDPQGLTRAELAGDRRAASAGALLFDTRKTVRQQQLGLKLGHGVGVGRLEAVVHGGGRDTLQYLSIPTAAQANPLSSGGVVDLDRGYGGADIRWQWRAELASRPAGVTVGAEYQRSSERRRGYENFAGSRLGVRGALRRDERDRVAGSDRYLQADWEFANRWRFDAGLRRSRIAFRSRDAFVTAANPDDSGRLEYAETTPVAGLLFRATDSASLYANAGKGFETPTFNELSYRSDGRSGLNAALRAARSDNVEAGLRIRRGEERLGLAFFRSATDDEIVVVANQGGRSTYANAASSLRRGAEFSWSGEWSPRWRYAFAYTYLDARYRDAFLVCGAAPCPRPNQTVAAGNRIPGLPRQQVWAELRWLPNERFDVGFEGQGIGRVFADDANSSAAPGYAVFDLGAQRRWRIGNMEAIGFARVQNLFDRRYIGSVIVNESNGRYFEPAPGRGWLIGIDLKPAP